MANKVKISLRLSGFMELSGARESEKNQVRKQKRIPRVEKSYRRKKPTEIDDKMVRGWGGP